MTAPTLSLADFLLARIDEDEAIARACVMLVSPMTWANVGRRSGSGRTQVRTDPPNSYGTTFPVAMTSDAQADHIARHDPARVLAECAAKRAILAEHESYAASHPITEAAMLACNRCSSWSYEGLTDETVAFPCPTVAALASVYADHPDYRDEWRA